ncbi:MAG: methyltransferase domain-containing protein, partial [Acidobacteriota bacterium]
EAEAREAGAATGAGHIVLDAGAGEARHKRYFPRGLYLALDAGWGNPSWDYSRLDIRGALESIPLRDGTVDRVLCMVVLEHTRHPERVLAEFARVLKGGGNLTMVVPFLWEEHQAPHDYFRFTRYGIRALMEGLPFEIRALDPIGGIFWVCARRCVNLLSVFQRGWRWPFFLLLAPFLGLIFPASLYLLDGLDREKHFSLGFRVLAARVRE